MLNIYPSCLTVLSGTEEHRATVTNPAGTSTLSQEEYVNQGADHAASGGMVERVLESFGTQQRRNRT